MGRSGPGMDEWGQQGLEQCPPPRSLGEISASPLQPRLAVSPEWRGGPVSPTLTCATVTVGPGPHRRSVQVSDALWLFPGIGSGSGAGGRLHKAEGRSRVRLVTVGPAVGRRRGPCPCCRIHVITLKTGSKQTGRAVLTLPAPS